MTGDEEIVYTAQSGSPGGLLAWAEGSPSDDPQPAPRSALHADQETVEWDMQAVLEEGSAGPAVPVS